MKTQSGNLRKGNYAVFVKTIMPTSELAKTGVGYFMAIIANKDAVMAQENA